MKVSWPSKQRRGNRQGLERLPFHFSLSCTGEGNGNPLQCSCLENPRDGGAWWAAVYGVTQSRTRLKWLSSSRVWDSTKDNLNELLGYARILFVLPHWILISYFEYTMDTNSSSYLYTFVCIVPNCLTNSMKHFLPQLALLFLLLLSHYLLSPRNSSF